MSGLLASMTKTASRVVWLGFLAWFGAGCGLPDVPLQGSPGSTDNFGEGGNLSCNLPTEFLFDGGPGRDGIPSLVNPPLVSAGDPSLRYLTDYDALRQADDFLPEGRVVGLVVDGQPIAVPHHILWWHEIVNFEIGLERLAITYCPLTASALVFDATSVTNRFGVSGLVFMNNLLMFDPETESLWPQMMREARCGVRTGRRLTVVPNTEMLWNEWIALHPDTKIVSSNTGWDRDYTLYPYDLYDASEFLLFPMDEILDRTRPGKERVLGVPQGTGGVAFPFPELESSGDLAVVRRTIDGESILVLWDGRARAARAFFARSESGGKSLTVEGDRFVDTSTGSAWSIEGGAIEGPRSGEQLEPVVDAYVAYWFAWAAFQPDTEVWTAK